MNYAPIIQPRKKGLVLLNFKKRLLKFDISTYFLKQNDMEK